MQILFIVALAFGMFEHEHEEAIHTQLNIFDEYWINLIFAAISLFVVWFIATAEEHVIKEHLWEHIIRKHFLSIFLWTFGALFVIQVGLHYFDIETLISNNIPWMILLAVLVGIIPESGPHLLFVTLFATGTVPFSVLLASSISQDGHASLPLLAESKRSFAKAKITNDIMAKIAVSSEVRIPTAEELTGNGYSILPATNLEPERCKGLTGGFIYHHTNSYGFIEIEANYFLNQLDDMIRYQADMIPSMARYANFGKVVTKGAEIDIKGDVTSFLYCYVNSTYQDLRDKRKHEVGSTAANPTYDKRMPNIPYFLANFGIELHKENLFGGKEQNSRFLLDASYIHEYFYDFEMSKYQDRKIPTSLTFDTGIEHSFGNNRWTLSFKLKNLTDRVVYSDLNRPLPGRNIAFKVKYIMK